MVSEATVKIKNMASHRPHNFQKANIECAKKWNAELYEGRNNWNPREVELWRQGHNYTWHERSDRMTMDLVQRDIHNECKHYGDIMCRAVIDKSYLHQKVKVLDIDGKTHYGTVTKSSCLPLDKTGSKTKHL